MEANGFLLIRKEGDNAGVHRGQAKKNQNYEANVARLVCL